MLTRIRKVRALVHMLKNIWKSRELTIKTKLMVFNSNLKTVLLYGCKTWCARKNQQKIQTFVNRCSRTIFRIRGLDKVPNEELWQRAKSGTNGKTNCEAEMELDMTSITRQALTWKLQGKRKGRAAKEQLKERHGDRNEETWNDVDRYE